MRMLIFLFISIVLFSYCSHNSKPEILFQKENTNLNEAANIEGYGQFEWEISHDPATGEIPIDRLFYANQVIQSRTTANKSIRNRLDQWEALGPVNIGGRTRAVVIDANDPTGNTVFAGSTSGGVYKSTAFKSDNPAWQQVAGIHANLSISAMIQDPKNPNHLYVGTGEGWGSENDSRGHGIWKSMDGGVNWVHLDNNREPAFWYVLDLELDQNGNLYASTNGQGVQKSKDGGNSWKEVLGKSVGNSDSDIGGDLEIGPDGDLYATTGIFDGGSVYKSDAKIHLDKIGEPSTWQEISPAGNYRRMEMAVAKSDENRLYLLCANESRAVVSAMYRSENGGATWNSISVPTLAVTNSGTPFSGNAAWFAMIARVDPNDEDVLYIGGIDIVRSKDAGETWVHLSNEFPNESAGYTGKRVVHTDQHEIVFFSGSSTEAIFTNDGGIYYSSNLDSKMPLFDPKNQQYNTTQFYSCAIFPGEILYLGGSQDNGNWAIGDNDQDPNERFFLGGGDGGYTLVSQKNSFLFSISASGIDLAITVNGGKKYYNFKLPGRGAFINPYTLDEDTEIFYGALDDDKYFIISDVVNQQGVESVVVPAFDGSQISALTPDPNVANRLWVGVRPYINNDGFWQGKSGVFRIDNAHTQTPIVKEFSDNTWNRFLAPRNIFIDYNDPDYMLLTFSNWGSPNVWITKNGGQTWINVDGDLPDMPVRWGIINPVNANELIIATELGVLKTVELDISQISGQDVQKISTQNGIGTKWVEYQPGMPNLRVNMLTLSENGQRLLAATWGQGLLHTTYSAPDLTSVTAQELAGVSIYPNPVSSTIHIDGLKNPTDSYYKVYDVQGRLIIQGSKAQRIIAEDWNSGNYLLEVGLISSRKRNIYKVVKL